MRCKKGQAGEGLMMIYRLALVTFIAVVVLGLSSVFYAHYVEVKDVEARIMAREIIDCLLPEGVLDLDKVSKGGSSKLLSYCGFDDLEAERFYVLAVVNDSGGEEIARLSQGDSGKLWVKKAFEEGVFDGNSEALKYRPGYFEWVYSDLVLKEGVREDGSILLNVLVNNEA